MINQPGTNPDTGSLNEIDQLIERFGKYMKDGKMVFAVTLTTNVHSERIAKSQAMNSFFENHFMGMIRKQLTESMKRSNLIDFEYEVECSPDGLWHMHGLLAMPMAVALRIWKRGALHPELARNLASMKLLGKLRLFKLLGHEIEPIRHGKKGLQDWLRYTRKTHDRHSSMAGTARIDLPELSLDPRFGRPTYNKHKPKDSDIRSGEGSPADAQESGTTDGDGAMSDPIRILPISSGLFGGFRRPSINREAFKDFDYSCEEAPLFPAELFRDGGSVPTPDGGAP